MRKLLIFLGILVLLLVGADFAGRAVAESKAGEAIARQANISPAPTFDIHGWSFLWQAVGGTYDHLSITTDSLTAGSLTGVTAVVDLYDVNLPLSDALGGNLDSITAGRVDVNLRVPAAALATAAGVPDATVTAGDNGSIRIGTTLQAAGQAVPVSLDLQVGVANGTLRLGSARVVEVPADVPAEAINPLLQDFSLNVPLDALPFELTTATATVADGELVLTSSASSVPLGELLAR